MPVYVRQTTNETTGENTAVMIRSLASDDEDTRWLRDYADDFRRRISSSSRSPRSLPAASPSHSSAPRSAPRRPPPAPAPTAAAARRLRRRRHADGGADRLPDPAHDLKRLRAHARSLVDYRLVVDLIPTLARLRFTGRLHIPLSAVQAAIFVGVGLQANRSTTSAPSSAFVAQLLALFNKTVRKLVAALTATLEEAEGATLPPPAADDGGAAAAAAGAPRWTTGSMPASASLAALQEKQQQQQRDWIADGDLAKYAIQGTDADWEAALKGGTRDGAPPRTVRSRAPTRQRATARRRAAARRQAQREGGRREGEGGERKRG